MELNKYLQYKLETNGEEETTPTIVNNWLKEYEFLSNNWKESNSVVEETFEVGDKVKIVSKGKEVERHEFDIGEIVTINRTDGDCSGSEYKYHCSDLRGEWWWWCRAKDIEKM